MVLAARLARDPPFAAALAASAAWLGLYAFAHQAANPGWALLDPLRFASLAIAWPLLEELVYRGALQPWLARTRWGARENWGITTANVATSLAFAGAHLAAHDPALAAATFLPSLVFGYFRDRYGSIAPGAALHIFYNAGWFLLAGA
ncbi:MAG TPA: JDVT-CTERM system glutamic-type intramembrane protease [Burkholderiales bacterium]|jgi:membrane protease YdiL (CAAX protease family)|nr:JDVT-CTERM system glutamic-type intramembrane protease [Burkholderiales bacterium]